MTFEEKREAKLARLQGLADKFAEESNDTAGQALSMAEIIPLGQPIHIGHHSEKRDRNYRNKINNKFRKSVELQDKSEYYARRAQAMENNNAIFSDDPDASEKLQSKIERLEKQQELMRSFNKLLKKNDIEGMLDLGFSESQIVEMTSVDRFGGMGFRSFELTNNSANIRRLKKRLEQTIKRDAEKTTEKEVNGVKMVDNVEENRLQLFFPGKPSEEVRNKLKSSGFRWCPSNGCWQAYRSNGHSAYSANNILQSYNGGI